MPQLPSPFFRIVPAFAAGPAASPRSTGLAVLPQGGRPGNNSKEQTTWLDNRDTWTVASFTGSFPTPLSTS